VSKKNDGLSVNVNYRRVLESVEYPVFEVRVDYYQGGTLNTSHFRMEFDEDNFKTLFERMMNHAMRRIQDLMEEDK
jgi:hypothetical protein